MRVIGGKFKGKKLIEPKDKETRPLKDLTKESIFNIINHSNKFSIDLKKAKVLDLFSGVGSFGIECLSQGASHVTFIEKYEAVLPILKKNLDNLKIFPINVGQDSIEKSLTFFEESFNNEAKLLPDTNDGVFLPVKSISVG